MSVSARLLQLGSGPNYPNEVCSQAALLAASKSLSGNIMSVMWPYLYSCFLPKSSASPLPQPALWRHQPCQS